MRLLIAALTLGFAGFAIAQQQPGGSRPSNGPGVGTSPNGNPNGTFGNSSNSPFPDATNAQRPIYISGKVVIADGTPLPEPAKINRICNGSPRTEGYTDRKGRFSIDLSHNTEFQDAGSVDSISDVMPGRGRTLASQGTGASGLWGCELLATLPGYQSDRVPLATIHYMDNPDVGTLILHPVTKVDGLTISVTSALAPKDARKAYQKAHEALLKKNPDDAQKDYEKAVEIYPKYSSAWYELGALNEQRDHFEEARNDYQQAIASEPKFLKPYTRLSWLWLRDSKWQELAEVTDQWLKLDPADSPDAYYLSSVANLQLQNFDVAEQKAREAIKLDTAKKNPRTYYVLGLALAQQRKFSDSADSLRTFLMESPEAKDGDVIRRQLAQVEAAAKDQQSQGEPQP